MKALAVLVTWGSAFVALATEFDRDLLKAMGKDQTRWIAHSYGAEARESFRVVDSGGNPVTNANVRCAFKVAAGANAVDGVDSNYDFQSQIVLDWPKKSGDENVWEHSDIKNVSYYFTHAIFEKIKNRE